MTLPYALRLACICLASFFLVHLVAGSLVCLSTPVMGRLSLRLRPASAARWILVSRFFPAAVALLAVGGLCVPSYVLHEPPDIAEGVGRFWLVAAALGVVVWMRAIFRGAQAFARSRTVAGSFPLVSLVGVLRPRVLIAPEVLATLPPEQLAVVLRHEQAHQESRDNLKRLLLFLAPGLLPFWRGFDVLERFWRRSAEWAADDAAVGGDPRQCLALAAALVNVSRLGMAPRPIPLSTSLLEDCRDLSSRVERLLGIRPAAVERRMVPRLVPLIAFLLATAFCARPGTLLAVHHLLETMTH